MKLRLKKAMARLLFVPLALSLPCFALPQYCWAAAQESNTLAPRSRLKHAYGYPSDRRPTKKPTPAGGYSIDVEFLRDLIAREKQRIIFSTAEHPAPQYRLRVLPDLVTRDSSEGQESPEYMIVVETIPKKEKDTIYPVGVMTALFVDDANYLHLHWTAVLDYPAINAEVAAFLDYLKTSDDPSLEEIGPTLRAHLQKDGYQILKAMKLYSMFDTEDEFHVQISLLLIYIIAAGLGDSDDEVLEFFAHAPGNLRGRGIGYAMGEFLSNLVPIGTKMKYGLGHGASQEIVKKGGTFQETPRGQWWRRLGFDWTEDLGDLTYVLEKRRPPHIVSKWENTDALGDHAFIAPNVTKAFEKMDQGLRQGNLTQFAL